jgi:hypothetical protein
MAFVAPECLEKILNFEGSERFRWRFSCLEQVLRNKWGFYLGVLGFLIFFAGFEEFEGYLVIVILVGVFYEGVSLFAFAKIEYKNDIEKVHKALRLNSHLTLYSFFVPSILYALSDEFFFQFVIHSLSVSLVWLSSQSISSNVIEIFPYYPPVLVFLTLLFSSFQVLSKIFQSSLLFIQDFWIPLSFQSTITMTILLYLFIWVIMNDPIKNFLTLKHMKISFVLPLILTNLNLLLWSLTDIFQKYTFFTIFIHTLICWQMCFKIKVLILCKIPVQKAHFTELMIESSMIIQELCTRILPQIPLFGLFVVLMSIRTVTWVLGTLLNINKIKKSR